MQLVINNMDFDSLIRNQIALNSASRYNQQKLSELGLQIATNLSFSKTRFVGDPLSPIYPDVIIWKPDFPIATTGKAVLIEFVETRKTLEENSVQNKWQKAAALGIPFNLLVPQSEELNIKLIATTNNIPIQNIFRYSLNPITKRYDFVKI